MDSIRTMLGRPVVPLLLMALAVLVAGCAQVGTATWNFWDMIWSLIALFFWVMLIWIFMAIFGDNFQRNDLSGAWRPLDHRAGLPAVPRRDHLHDLAPQGHGQDVQMMTQAEAAQRAAASVTPADQIAKLQELKATGAITEEEYQALKTKAIG